MRVSRPTFTICSRGFASTTVLRKKTNLGPDLARLLLFALYFFDAKLQSISNGDGRKPSFGVPPFLSSSPFFPPSLSRGKLHRMTRQKPQKKGSLAYSTFAEKNR